MDIDAAISKLSEFKKLAASSGTGACDLIGFDDGSFTVKVKFGEDVPQRKSILGFAEWTERKPRRKKGTIKS